MAWLLQHEKSRGGAERGDEGQGSGVRDGCGRPGEQSGPGTMCY